jgi:hypothetical protein
MKLKFKKKKTNPDLPVVEKPDIYEDESYARWRRWLILFGVPLIIALPFIQLLLKPEAPIKPVMWGSALGSACFIIAVSMIKEDTKRFWIIFTYIFIIFNLMVFDLLPDISSYLLGSGYFSDLLNTTAFLGIPFLYFSYYAYQQWKEHNRCAIKKSRSDIPEDKIVFKKAQKKSKLINNLKKKLKIKGIKRGQSLETTIKEPAKFSLYRARLTIWGLPLIVGIVFSMPFFYEVSDYPKYVTGCAMAIGALLFLTSMVRPDCMRFWIIFFLILIIGTPMVLMPPNFLPKHPLTQACLISCLFLGAALFYKIRTLKRQ